MNEQLMYGVVINARVFMQVVACMYTRHSAYVCVQHAGLIHVYIVHTYVYNMQVSLMGLQVQ